MITAKQTNTPTHPEVDSAASIPEACCSPMTAHAQVHIHTRETVGNVKLLSALADPTRLGIVSMLSGLDEPLCVCEIVSEFELGQPTISHHLRVLREARLVRWEKRGLWVYYSLDHDTLAQVASYLTGLPAGAGKAHAVGA